MAQQTRIELLRARLRAEQKSADHLDQLHAAGLATNRDIRRSEDRLDRLVRQLAEADDEVGTK